MHACMQIARSLYTWTGNPFYADYYERALFNGMLGVWRGENEENHQHALEEEKGARAVQRAAVCGACGGLFPCCCAVWERVTL